MNSELSDEELIERIQNKHQYKFLIELLNRYRPLIYNRSKYIFSQYHKTILDYEDIMRIFEMIFFDLVKKYDLKSKIRFAGYISFYLSLRVNDNLRKYTRGNKPIALPTLSYDERISLFEFENNYLFNNLDMQITKLNTIMANNYKELDVTKQQKQILNFLYNGTKPKAISVALNIEVENVYRLISVTKSAIKQKLMEKQ